MAFTSADMPAIINFIREQGIKYITQDDDTITGVGDSGVEYTGSLVDGQWKEAVDGRFAGKSSCMGELRQSWGLPWSE